MGLLPRVLRYIPEKGILIVKGMSSPIHDPARKLKDKVLTQYAGPVYF